MQGAALSVPPRFAYRVIGAQGPSACSYGQFLVVAFIYLWQCCTSLMAWPVGTFCFKLYATKYVNIRWDFQLWGSVFQNCIHQLIAFDVVWVVGVCCDSDELGVICVFLCVLVWWLCVCMLLLLCCCICYFLFALLFCEVGCQHVCFSCAVCIGLLHVLCHGFVLSAMGCCWLLLVLWFL